MVETGRAAVLDLDLAAVQKLQRTNVRYQPLRRFPTSAFDLTVIAPARASIEQIESRIATLAGERSGFDRVPARICAAGRLAQPFLSHHRRRIRSHA